MLLEKFGEFDQIVELGFGLPYLHLYLAERGELDKMPSTVLVDYYASAVDVSREIMKYLGVENTNVFQSDIQDPKAWDMIRSSYIDGRRLFVAIEIIEHLKTPEAFWKGIKRFSGDDIILSLPVGPAIPSHQLVLSTIEEAEEYVEKYVDITEKRILTPDEKQGDGLDDFKVLVVQGVIK